MYCYECHIVVNAGMQRVGTEVGIDAGDTVLQPSRDRDTQDTTDQSTSSHRDWYLVIYLLCPPWNCGFFFVHSLHSLISTIAV